MPESARELLLIGFGCVLIFGCLRGTWTLYRDVTGWLQARKAAFRAEVRAEYESQASVAQELRRLADEIHGLRNQNDQHDRRVMNLARRVRRLERFHPPPLPPIEGDPE